MPAVKVFLNAGYQKKNGECAVYLLVHINYKSLKFPTGVSCLAENWNEKTLRIKGASKKIKDENLIIERALAQMNDIFVRYRLQNILLTPELLRNEWKNPARRIDFYKFFEEAIAERKHDIANQTQKNHMTAIAKLKEYKRELAFAEITPDFLEGYRRWLRQEKKNDINTVHSSMKIIKAYLNIAIRKGIIVTNPFSEVKVREAKTDRLFLSIDELQTLWQAYNSNKLKEHERRDLRHYLFMCFSGCRISDFRRLTADNIIGNTLVYFPAKTAGVKSQAVKVPLSKYALQLIADENRKGLLLFSAISEQKLNESIKVIAAKLGVYKKLTNHSARHTFATVWLSTTHDLAVLQRLLGHSKITDTMKYVHITDDMMHTQMKAFEKSVFKKQNKKSPRPSAGG